MENHKLAVYNRARILANQIQESTRKLKRRDKYGYVDPMVLSVYRIMEYISFANERIEDRIAFIDKALEEMDHLRIKARVLLDMKYVKPSGYDAIIREEENVVRQLKGWRNKTEEKQNIECGVTAESPSSRGNAR